MAKLEKGILGAASGKIRNVVLCRLHNTEFCYVRSLPKEYHDRKSPEQMKNRTNFDRAVKFFSLFSEFCGYTMREIVRDKRYSAYNFAMHINYHNMLTFDEESRAYCVNYDRIKLSLGRLTSVSGLTVIRHEKQFLLGWDAGGCNALNPCDRIQVGVYNEDRGEAMTFLDVARRGDGLCSLALKEGWECDRLHFYVSLVNEEGECSTSAYLCYGCEEERVRWIGGDSIFTAETCLYVCKDSELDLVCLGVVGEQSASKEVDSRYLKGACDGDERGRRKGRFGDLVT